MDAVSQEDKLCDLVLGTGLGNVEQVLASQWIENEKAWEHRAPAIRRLQCAMLFDAISNVAQYVRASVVKRRVHREALEWISADDWNYPLSYFQCCTGLGIDPYAMRRVIRRWIQAMEAGTVPPRIKMPMNSERSQHRVLAKGRRI